VKGQGFLESETIRKATYEEGQADEIISEPVRKRGAAGKKSRNGASVFSIKDRLNVVGYDITELTAQGFNGISLHGKVKVKTNAIP